MACRTTACGSSAQRTSGLKSTTFLALELFGSHENTAPNHQAVARAIEPSLGEMLPPLTIPTSFSATPRPSAHPAAKCPSRPTDEPPPAGPKVRLEDHRRPMPLSPSSFQLSYSPNGRTFFEGPACGTTPRRQVPVPCRLAGRSEASPRDPTVSLHTQADKPFTACAVDDPGADKCLVRPRPVRS